MSHVHAPAPSAAPPAARRRRLAGPVATLVGVGLAWAAVAALDPGDSGPVACPWRWLTGLDCPFCGSTRAVAALSGGDLVGALDRNALFVLVILPLSALAWLLWTRRAWRGRGGVPAVSTRSVLALLALLGAWWILRLVVPWLGSSAA